MHLYVIMLFAIAMGAGLLLVQLKSSVQLLQRRPVNIKGGAELGSLNNQELTHPLKPIMPALLSQPLGEVESKVYLSFWNTFSEDRAMVQTLVDGLRSSERARLAAKIKEFEDKAAYLTMSSEPRNVDIQELNVAIKAMQNLNEELDLIADSMDQ